MLFIFVKLLVFQPLKSKLVNFTQDPNIPLAAVNEVGFHVSIPIIDDNDEQVENIPAIPSTLLTFHPVTFTLVNFEDLPSDLINGLKEFKNLTMVQADISKDFIKGIEKTNDVILFATVHQTDAELYKQVKQMLNDMNKNILREVLL